MYIKISLLWKEYGSSFVKRNWQSNPVHGWFVHSMCAAKNLWKEQQNTRGVGFLTPEFVARTTNRMTRLSVSLWLPSAESISSWSWSDFWLHARLLQINWWKNKTCHHESVLKNDKHIPDIHGHKEMWNNFFFKKMIHIYGCTCTVIPSTI